MLGEGPTNGINGSIGVVEKKVSINFSETMTKFFLSLHYNGVIVICLLTEKKSVSLKQIIKLSIFPLNFA